MMLALQGPVPPVPPVPPGFEASFPGSLDSIAAVIVLLGGVLILAALLWPLIRAVARRIEGGASSPEIQAELETLRERVLHLEEMQPRMAELEERVDFAERVVAQGREPDRLQR